MSQKRVSEILVETLIAAGSGRGTELIDLAKSNLLR